MKPKILLALAAEVARFDSADLRQHRHGCVALRRDGVLVAARNGASNGLAPSAHAEARVLRKSGKGAILYVARVGRDGGWRNSMPCIDCVYAMRARKVGSVYFTLGPGEWGVVSL